MYTGPSWGGKISEGPGGTGGHQDQSIIRVSRAHALTSGRWLVERQWWIKRPNWLQEIIEFVAILALNFKGLNFSYLFE